MELVWGVSSDGRRRDPLVLPDLWLLPAPVSPSGLTILASVWLRWSSFCLAKAAKFEILGARRGVSEVSSTPCRVIFQCAGSPCQPAARPGPPVPPDHQRRHRGERLTGAHGDDQSGHHGGGRHRLHAVFTVCVWVTRAELVTRLPCLAEYSTQRRFTILPKHRRMVVVFIKCAKVQLTSYAFLR